MISLKITFKETVVSNDAGYKKMAEGEGGCY